MFLRSGAVGVSVGSASELVWSDSFLYRPRALLPSIVRSVDCTGSARNRRTE